MKEEILANIIIMIIILVCIAIFASIGISKEVCLMFAFSTYYFCFLHLEIRRLKDDLLKKTLLDIQVSVQDEVNKMIKSTIHNQVLEHINKNTRLTDHRIDLDRDQK